MSALHGDCGWSSVPDIEGCEITEWGRMRRDGRELTLRCSQSQGYVSVTVRSTAYRVHVLVATTFHGPRPFAGAEVRHLNGDPADNWVGNLAWGTRRENSLDTIRHGRNVNTQRTRCPLDHPLALPNLDPSQLKLGRRSCLACHKAHARNYRLRVTDRAQVDHKILADHYFAQLDMETSS